MTTAVLLINPKVPFNVGAALRACAIYDVPWLRWTGERVSPAMADFVRAEESGKKGGRLPREERMKDYLGVDRKQDERALDTFIAEGLTPVAVEVRREAERLVGFVHPEEAVYIFGPEDGSIPKGTLTICHRFVRIPTATRTPLNLAMAVNTVLYDRFVKSGEPDWTMTDSQYAVR